MHYVNCKELRNFCKGWYPWYNKPTFRCYLKSNDVKHIKELSVTMDDVCQRGRYEFRSLKPEVLNINIDSDKSRYSGVLITELFDLKNVVKFRLSYPKRGFTVGSWYNIPSDLLRVSELDITLGCIENLSEFFRYEKKSISKFRLTLLGSRKLDLFNVASYRDFTLSYLEPALTSNDVYVLNLPGSE